MIFADLCCGSGAVSLRLIAGVAGEPPAPYMGGKRRYAPAILDMLGIRAERPDRLVMVDAGCWGAFWQTAIVDGKAQAIADELRRIGARPEKGCDLFKAIAKEPVPEDPVSFCARFMALQHGNAMGRPVVLKPDGSWRVQGYAHLSKAARSKRMAFKERLRPFKVADEVLRVAGLDWPDLVVINAPLQDACLGLLGEGDVAYFDPPYQGTTGYGPAVLSRLELKAIADRLAARGVMVGISEGEAIGWDGWHAELVHDGGGFQARRAKTIEWLTTSIEPARVVRQQALF